MSVPQFRVKGRKAIGPLAIQRRWCCASPRRNTREAQTHTGRGKRGQSDRACSLAPWSVGTSGTEKDRSNDLLCKQLHRT